jgi:cell division protein DivIC
MAAGTAVKQTTELKGARRRLRLFLTIVCAFSVWAGLSLWEQTGSMTDKKAEMHRLQLKLEEVRAQNEAYKSEVTRLHDSEYIEQKVRKDFGMVRPGDKVFGVPAE